MNDIVLNREKLESDRIATLRDDVRNIIEQCSRVEVSNRDQFAAVGDLVRIGRSRHKEIDELRLAETKKPREYVDWVNKRFKEYLLNPLDNALKSAAGKAKAWADEEDRRRRAEAERLRRQQEEEEMRRAEEAEKARQAAEAKRREADEQARLAAEAHDRESAEAAREAADRAAEEAAEAGHQVDEALDRAASAEPIGDTAVRKVRGAYGSTAGMRRTLRVKINNLRHLDDAFVAAIMRDDVAVDRMRIAIQKDPVAKARFDQLRGQIEHDLNTASGPDAKVEAAGLLCWYETTFAAR